MKKKMVVFMSSIILLNQLSWTKVIANDKQNDESNAVLLKEGLPSVGDKILLGKYKHAINSSGVYENQYESMTWTVLEDENNELTLMNDYVIDFKNINESGASYSWSSSSLNSWLNNESDGFLSDDNFIPAEKSLLFTQNIKTNIYNHKTGKLESPVNKNKNKIYIPWGTTNMSGLWNNGNNPKIGWNPDGDYNSDKVLKIFDARTRQGNLEQWWVRSIHTGTKLPMVVAKTNVMSAVNNAIVAGVRPFVKIETDSITEVSMENGVYKLSLFNNELNLKGVEYENQIVNKDSIIEIVKGSEIKLSLQKNDEVIDLDSIKTCYEIYNDENVLIEEKIVNGDDITIDTLNNNELINGEYIINIWLEKDNGKNSNEVSSIMSVNFEIKSSSLDHEWSLPKGKNIPLSTEEIQIKFNENISINDSSKISIEVNGVKYYLEKDSINIVNDLISMNLKNFSDGINKLIIKGNQSYKVEILSGTFKDSYGAIYDKDIKFLFETEEVNPELPEEVNPESPTTPNIPEKNATSQLLNDNINEELNNINEKEIIRQNIDKAISNEEKTVLTQKDISKFKEEVEIHNNNSSVIIKNPLPNYKEQDYENSFRIEYEFINHGNKKNSINIGNGENKFRFEINIDLINNLTNKKEKINLLDKSQLIIDIPKGLDIKSYGVFAIYTINNYEYKKFIPHKLSDDGKKIIVHNNGYEQIEISDSKYTLTDIEKEYWAYDYAKIGLDKNIIDNYGDNSFRPRKLVSYTEFVNQIEKIFNVKINEVTNDKDFTREKMAYLTSNLLEELGVIFRENEKKNWLNLKDKDMIDSKYISHIENVIGINVIIGTDENKFLPKKEVNKEETTAVIIRILRLMDYID